MSHRNNKMENRTAKRFFNWTNEDFTGMWDRVEYLIKKGETMMFPDYLANHFAKHLTDREMFKAKMDTSLNNELARKPFIDKCFTGEEVSAATDLEAEVKAMNVKPVETTTAAVEVVPEEDPTEPVDAPTEPVDAPTEPVAEVTNVPETIPEGTTQEFSDVI